MTKPGTSDPNWRKAGRKSTLYLMKSGKVWSLELLMMEEDPRRQGRTANFEFLKQAAVDTRKVNTDAQHAYLEDAEWCRAWYNDWLKSKEGRDV